MRIIPFRNRSHPSRLWLALADAPHLPIVAYLGFISIKALIVGSGVVPPAMDRNLPLWLIFAWTVAIAAGGVAATVGGFMRYTRMESAGLGLIGYGATVYGVVVSYAVESLNRDLTVIAVAVAIVTMCVIRMRVLSLARHAQVVAQNLTEDNGESDGI